MLWNSGSTPSSGEHKVFCDLGNHGEHKGSSDLLGVGNVRGLERFKMSWEL